MNQPDPYQQWLQTRRQSPPIDVTQSVLSAIEQEPLKPAPSYPPTLHTRVLFAAQCLAIASGLLCGFFRLTLLLIPFSSLQ